MTKEEAYYPSGLTKDLPFIMDTTFRNGFLYAIQLAETWCDLESLDPMCKTGEEYDRTDELIMFLKEKGREP